MSGRICDYGINPKCKKCGSKMWTSRDRNFNGAKCKRYDCDGEPIYQAFGSDKKIVKQKYKTKDTTNNYVLFGGFISFSEKTKTKYVWYERLRNTLFTIKEKIKNII